MHSVKFMLILKKVNSIKIFGIPLSIQITSVIVTTPKVISIRWQLKKNYSLYNKGICGKAVFSHLHPFYSYEHLK